MPPASKPSKQEIYASLRERICLLDLPPGTPLREEALAAEFGVSRTPIRQVLDRLEFERLVTQRPGAGSVVSSVDMKSLRDVWSVRLKIAELVGEFVRLPAPPDVIARVRAVDDGLEEIRATDDVRALGASYNAYHAAVLEVIDNETLRRIHDQLYLQTARVWMQFLPELDLDTEIDVMHDELSQTLDALAGDSGAWLAEIRAKHMRMLLARFNQLLARPLA